jgi:hypothetical protein
MSEQILYYNNKTIDWSIDWPIAWRNRHLLNFKTNSKKIKPSWIGFMVFNTTFSNISVVLWLSVLLLQETGGIILQ